MKKCLIIFLFCIVALSNIHTYPWLWSEWSKISECEYSERFNFAIYRENKKTYNLIVFDFYYGDIYFIKNFSDSLHCIDMFLQLKNAYHEIKIEMWLNVIYEYIHYTSFDEKNGCFYLDINFEDIKGIDFESSQ